MNALTTAVSGIVVAGGGHGPWTDGGGPGFPFFLVPLFWLLLIAGIAIFALAGRRRRAAAAGRRTGEQRLAERYAEGSIDEEDFRARRAVLREK